MVEAAASGAALSGMESVQTVHVKPDVTIDLIAAGSGDASYASRVQSLDWEHLYSQDNLGHVLEQWRTEWMRRYDIVLVDSRTGITDIGGICTAQLPDVLLLFFTANQQSIDGALQVLDQAISTRNRLVFDRPRLLTVPVPSRFDQGVEYERSEKWRQVFQNRFAHCYRDWAAQGVPLDVLIGLYDHPILGNTGVSAKNSRYCLRISARLPTSAIVSLHSRHCWGTGSRIVNCWQLVVTRMSTVQCGLAIDVADSRTMFMRATLGRRRGRPTISLND